MIKTSVKTRTIDNKFFNISNFNNASDKKLRQYCDKVNRVARAKYVPVATGRTLTSCKSTKISQNNYALSSINWGGKANNPDSGRYVYTKPNKSYYASAGYGSKVFVPAGKNAGKYIWFNRASEELKNSFEWEL